MKHILLRAGLVAVLALNTYPAMADEEPPINISGGHNHGIQANFHAPIGVMSDHMHGQGEWMASYRFKRMEMSDLRDGTNDLSPEEIVTGFANPNAPPPTFRVVPTDMRMDMHMFGLMYGAADWITLMAMGMYMQKDMDHITFAGMTGTTQLGEFSTRSSGWSDSRLSALVRLHEDAHHHLHLNLGLSIPTGSIDEEDDVLTPMNTRPTLRLPYAMQLGSGTWDALPGLTYTWHHRNWRLGAQYTGEIRLEDENDEGYSWGDKHSTTAWAGYVFTPWLQGSLRLSAETMDKIDGADPLITAPVTTADPGNYGGEIIEGGAGFQIVPESPAWQGLQIGVEITAPLHQDLNGPQMKRDWTGVLGLQYAF